MKGVGLLVIAIFFYGTAGAEYTVWHEQHNSLRNSIQNGSDFSADNEIALNMHCLSDWKDANAFSVAYDETRGIAFLGSYGCMCVLDVTDMSTPVQVGQCAQDADCPVYDLFYEQSTQRLYIAAGLAGVCVLDVADPSQPTLLGHYDTPGHASGIFVEDACVYVADGDAGIRIIDASMPSEMQEIGLLMTTTACGICVSGQYAYIADLGLRIVDISNPRKPRTVACYDTPGVAYNLDLVESLIYIADDWCGLRIIDISNPEAPKEIGFYDTPGYAYDVKIKGNYAYVADGIAGVRIIDISEPDHCKEISFTDMPAAFCIYSCNNYVFVGDASLGLKIFKLE